MKGARKGPLPKGVNMLELKNIIFDVTEEDGSTKVYTNKEANDNQRRSRDYVIPESVASGGEH